MAEDDWNIDENRHPPRRVLSPMERNFILTGDPGSASKSKMRSRIGEKVEAIPERLQDLVDDISLLYVGGYLDDETEPQIDLTEIESRVGAARNQPIEDGPIDGELAFEFGHLVRMLSVDDTPDDLVWAFLLGLVGQDADNFEHEMRQIEVVLDQLQDNHNRRIFQAGTKVIDDDYGEGLETERNVVRETLLKRNLTPVYPLVRSVLIDFLDGSDRTVDSKEVQIHDGSSGISHPKQPDDVDFSGGEDYYRYEMKNIVDGLVAETPIEEIDSLCADLRMDISAVHQHQQYGTYADDILQSIYSAEGRVPVDEIRGDNPSNFTTAVLKRLSENDERILWTQHPIVRESSEQKWEITNYGRMLGYVMFDRDEETLWIYDFVINSQSLSDKENQLINRVIEEVSF